MDFQGHKFVAVGNALYYDRSWKTFTDFLWTYLPGMVGKEWGDAETKSVSNKAVTERGGESSDGSLPRR
jgi:hypothetical protein